MKLLVAAMCLLAAASPLRAELLQNPSFEEQGSAADLAAHWSRWGQWINRETEWTPTRTGKCLIGYHHWQIEDGANSGLWQDITGMKPGQRCRFSVFVWFDPTTTPVQEVELKLEATRHGHQVAIGSAKFSPKDFPSGQWYPFSVTGTTPEDHVRVLIVVTPAPNSPRGGAVKFDDASLVVVGSGTQ